MRPNPACLPALAARRRAAEIQLAPAACRRTAATRTAAADSRRHRAGPIRSGFFRSALFRSALLGSALLGAIDAHAQAGATGSIRERVASAMQSEIRTEEERARDANRRPAEVLEFFGLEDDMRVIEILPFSGWYTKLLAPVLRDNGKLYVTHPSPTFYSEAFTDVPSLPGMDAVEEIAWGASGTEGGTPFFASGRWDVEPVDMVLTFRNYHNFSPEARTAVNDSVYAALKPGGIYGIVDHTRRHMEPGSRENGRRMDPVLVIKEVQAAGFEFVDYSDLLRRPEDALRLEVGRPEVAGRSDRFALLFRKPE